MRTELPRLTMARGICPGCVPTFVVPVMLALTALACSTVVTAPGQYTCPTAIPWPTTTVMPGTPIPTLAPPPTPYTIVPPQDFYVGDAIFVGQPGAAMRLRFRLQNVQVQPAGGQYLVTWQLAIHNAGTTTYEALPPMLMLITRLATASGPQSGTWRTAEAAMKLAGFTSENYEALSPGATRLYRLAAFIPTGNVSQFAYLLDGDGGNRITWTNQINPYCFGDVSG
jgi:hypothetical protein